MSVGRLLIISGLDITVDDCGGGMPEGENVFDTQDKLRESEFLRQGISIWDAIQEIHEPIHFNAFLLEGLKEKMGLGFIIKGHTDCLHPEIVMFEIGTKGTDGRCFINVRRGRHLVIELTFCLLEQGTKKCICLDAAGNIQNVILIQDVNNFIIQIQRASLIKT
jgi:hypothetical protein